MNKKNIYFKADEQLLTNITPNCFASDTVAYIEAHFDLGENWSGFDSVRAVWTNGAAVISSVLYDGACIVPWEVLTKRAEVKVNLVGSNVENDELIDRLTTCQVPALNIKCKALIEGSNTATPTPSEYEQFVQNVHEDADRAEAARDEAEQILTDTEQIKTDVENLKTQTLAIKVETESIKGDVETLKSQTEDLVDGFNDEVEEALDGISAKEDDVLYDIDSAKTSALGEINNKETLALAEIVNAKSSALTDISSARVTTLTEIQTEGTTQKNLVTTEGQTQVANVQTEGETQIQAIEDKGAEVIASIPNFAPIITDTVSGDIVSFTDGADGYPMKSVKVSLQPKQSGSGDPSPSNVRPISGWDEVIISQTPYPQTTKPHAITGKNIFQGNTYYRPTPCHIEIGQTFTASASGQCGIRWYDANMNQLDYWTSLPNTTTDGRKYRTYTMNTGCEYFEFYGSGDVTDFMVEIGSTPSPYEPYGQSHSISFPSTVYGGSDEIISGVGKSEWRIVDGGDLAWEKIEGNNYANFFAQDFRSTALFIANEPTAICSHYKAESNNTVSPTADNYIWFNANKIIRIKDTAKANMTASEFKTAMTGVQICYRLATPTDFNTTPTEIKSLKGNNTLWSDGEVECEYCADTKLYIDKKINALI